MRGNFALSALVAQNAHSHEGLSPYACLLDQPSLHCLLRTIASLWGVCRGAVGCLSTRPCARICTNVHTARESYTCRLFRHSRAPSITLHKLTRGVLRVRSVPRGLSRHFWAFGKCSTCILPYIQAVCAPFIGTLVPRHCR